MPYKDKYGNLLKSVEDGMTPESMEAMYPATELPRIPTMDKKLIIEAAVPGWQPVKWYRDRGVQKLPPRTIEEQSQAIADCVKAGAAIIHNHPIDPETGIPRTHDPKLLAEILDRAFDKVGDFVTINGAIVWDFNKSPYADYVSAARDLLEIGKGNKYIQGSPIMTWGILHYGEPDHDGTPFLEGMKWLEEHDIKPAYQMHMYRFHRIKRMLFDSGVSKWKPYVINIHTGKHEDEQIDIEPWGQIETIKNIYTIRETLPDSCIGVYPGGRNWLPIMVQGIMQGCDLVRTGTEDIFWLWPHRDEISTTSAQTTEMVVTIAKTLGREIATPVEAREILGMKLTSK